MLRGRLRDRLAKLAAGLGERAVWDCHTGGDDPSDGNVTAGALLELQKVLQGVGSRMRAAVLVSAQAISTSP